MVVGLLPVATGYGFEPMSELADMCRSGAVALELRSFWHLTPTGRVCLIPHFEQYAIVCEDLLAML